MKLNVSKLLHFVFIGSLVANASLTFSLFPRLREISTYRKDVEALAVDFYCYATNLEYKIDHAQYTQSPFTPGVADYDSLTSSDYLKTIGTLHYSYCVVRGSPGLLCGSFFYPVGSATAYGTITSCGFDFVEFDGCRRFVLRPQSDTIPHG